MKITIPVTVQVFVRNHHDKMTIFAQRCRKEVGKQEPYLKQRLEELEKLVESQRKLGIRSATSLYSLCYYHSLSG